MGKTKYKKLSFERSSIQKNIALENQDYYNLNRQKIDRFGQDTKHRGILVFWTMGLISVWLILVLAVVIWCKHLSDTVLTTLLATTTINVLGLAKIVLGNLFPRRNNSNKNHQ